MEGAQGVLMSIAGGSDLGLFEINEAASLVQDAAHQDANIIFGTVIDDSLGDEVRVTVIAAGFDASGPGRTPIVGTTTAAAANTGIAPGKAGKISSSLFEPRRRGQRAGADQRRDLRPRPSARLHRSCARRHYRSVCAKQLDITLSLWLRLRFASWFASSQCNQGGRHQ